VKKDVKAICAQVAKKLWRDQDKVLFNIFLRRSDTHIASVINSFDEIENKPLDEAIMGYDHLHRFAKNILLHAIRSVSNMARRDALYLRQDVDYNRSVVWDPVDTERLCARVCRMHKYPQHWHVIMKDFENLANGSFISSIRGAPKPYSKFMVNIYEMICSQ
jgi:hypothetical protein